jgi:hypothetical protein
MGLRVVLIRFQGLTWELKRLSNLKARLVMRKLLFLPSSVSFHQYILFVAICPILVRSCAIQPYFVNTHIQAPQSRDRHKVRLSDKHNLLRSDVTMLSIYMTKSNTTDLI